MSGGLASSIEALPVETKVEANVAGAGAGAGASGSGDSSGAPVLSLLVKKNIKELTKALKDFSDFLEVSCIELVRLDSKDQEKQMADRQQIEKYWEWGESLQALAPKLIDFPLLSQSRAQPLVSSFVEAMGLLKNNFFDYTEKPINKSFVYVYFKFTPLHFFINFIASQIQEAEKADQFRQAFLNIEGLFYSRSLSKQYRIISILLDFLMGKGVYERESKAADPNMSEILKFLLAPREKLSSREDLSESHLLFKHLDLARGVIFESQNKEASCARAYAWDGFHERVKKLTGQVLPNGWGEPQEKKEKKEGVKKKSPISGEALLTHVLNNLGERTAQYQAAEVRSAELREQLERVGREKSELQVLLEQARLDQAKLEQARLDQARLEQARLDQARLEQARLDQARLEQARLDQAKLEQARLEQARLDQARLEQAKLTQAAGAKSKQREDALMQELVILTREHAAQMQRIQELKGQLRQREEAGKKPPSVEAGTQTAEELVRSHEVFMQVQQAAKLAEEKLVIYESVLKRKDEEIAAGREVQEQLTLVSRKFAEASDQVGNLMLECEKKQRDIVALLEALKAVQVERAKRKAQQRTAEKQGIDLVRLKEELATSNKRLAEWESLKPLGLDPERVRLFIESSGRMLEKGPVSFEEFLNLRVKVLEAMVSSIISPGFMKPAYIDFKRVYENGLEAGRFQSRAFYEQGQAQGYDRGYHDARLRYQREGAVLGAPKEGQTALLFGLDRGACPEDSAESSVPVPVSFSSSGFSADFGADFGAAAGSC